MSIFFQNLGISRSLRKGICPSYGLDARQKGGLTLRNLVDNAIDLLFVFGYDTKEILRIYIPKTGETLWKSNCIGGKKL